ncbi:hypothetical protein M9H77_06367 [Catharanthus roseus]|uniref:Uncharacterized protein n=1 Tax=Catharanthus roseus TaxID=4058 RepID=A0ACC0BS70_CATRO|nr:hypothetical protein M9H77_06367 [Catharanthus roseus]
MMSEGYAWLVTDSLGNFLNSIDSTAFDSMEGVLGIRPHVPRSEKLKNFEERWKKNMILRKSTGENLELNVYGIWAYDTVWALAMAVEKIRPANSGFLKLKDGRNGSDISNLKLSQFGPKLLSELYNTSFLGLSGEFKLINGQLKSSALEIFNVIETGGRTVGGGRPIGYWTPDGGITRTLGSTDYTTYSASMKELKTIVWPGDSLKKPLGWSIPLMGKLKVGVPYKSGFTEFVNVTEDPVTKKVNATGFSIDIFLSTLQFLPFNVDHEFVHFDPEETAYSEFINSLPNKSMKQPFDIMVGDFTILADRARYVDFSLPYSESGIVWVVKNKQEKNMWIFIKPFRWDLWLTILATCIFIGVVLRILEHRENCNLDPERPERQHLGMLLLFPIAALAFPERNMVANSWSRFVLVVWLFASYILMQSYTANLSAMFTIDQLDFRLSQDYYIGYQVGSYVRDFLINRHHISASKLREYSSIEKYHDAMTKGGKNGGIDAIVDEIPYMKLFLGRYGSEYKMLEQRYRMEGFGFAFPKESPLVVPFSRAILDVTADPSMAKIEEKNFGPGYSSGNEFDSIDKQTSLKAYNFGGLFIVIGSALIFAIFCSLGQKIINLAAVYSLKYCSFLTFGGSALRTNSIVHPAVDSKDLSSEQEVEISEQIVENDLAIPDIINHQSGQGLKVHESDNNNEF